jgi:hypothetical protein
LSFRRFGGAVCQRALAEIGQRTNKQEEAATDGINFSDGFGVAYALLDAAVEVDLRRPRNDGVCVDSGYSTK